MLWFGKKDKIVCSRCGRKIEAPVKYGMCEKCSNKLGKDVDHCLDIIRENYSILMKTDNSETFFSRYQTVKYNIAGLMEYCSLGATLSDETAKKIAVIEQTAEERTDYFVKDNN